MSSWTSLRGILGTLKGTYIGYMVYKDPRVKGPYYCPMASNCRSAPASVDMRMGDLAMLP